MDYPIKEVYIKHHSKLHPTQQWSLRFKTDKCEEQYGFYKYYQHAKSDLKFIKDNYVGVYYSSYGDWNLI